MSIVTYIFGNLKSGYTQFPDDSAKDTFKSLFKKSKAATSVVVHRDSDLMYYGYIRKFGKGKYIGLCYAIRSKYITKADVLFSIFEQTIADMAKRGAIIHYGKDGELTTDVSSFADIDEECEVARKKLSEVFNIRVSNLLKDLPAQDNSVQRDSVKVCSIKEYNEKIISASYTFGYTVLYKDEDFNTVEMNTFKGVLNRLNKENNRLKKNILLSALLISAVIFLIAAIIFLITNKNEVYSEADIVTQKQEQAANNDIDAQLYMGNYHRNNNNSDSAFYYYYLAAINGDATAQNQIGDFFKNGFGVEQNSDSAFYWWYKAAEQELDIAQLHVALCYQIGEGTDEDYKKFLYWCDKAASQGNASAKQILANKQHPNPKEVFRYTDTNQLKSNKKQKNIRTQSR